MPRWALVAAAPFLPLTPPVFSPSISASLRARRALNYGDNAARSSGLIELLLESHDAVFALRKKGKRERERKKASFLAPPLPPSSHQPAPSSSLARGNDLSNGVNFREIISSACETRLSRPEVSSNSKIKLAQIGVILRGSRAYARPGNNANASQGTKTLAFRRSSCSREN